MKIIWSTMAFNFSHNQLSSFFPDEFGSLTSLRVLNIVGNNFVGSLPTTIADMSSFDSLDIWNNRFTGPLPNNMPKGLIDFNAYENDLSGVVPEVHRKFPNSSSFLGNAKLHFRNSHPGSTVSPTESSKGKSMSTVVKVTILLAVFIHSQESLDRFIQREWGSFGCISWGSRGFTQRITIRNNSPWWKNCSCS